MALIQAFLGEMSGKLNGSVYARNRGGTYVRKWAKPTNPNTAPQQAARAAMSALVTAWLGTLSALQRAAWETYAANVPMVNRLGQAISLTGQNHFIRSNSPRIQAGLASVEDAPVIFNLGTLNPLTGAATEAPQEINVTYDDTQDWCDEDDSALILQNSREMSATRNFFKGPFQFNAVAEGDSVAPPASPVTLVPLFALTEGNVVYVRARLSQADGRLSSVQVVRCVITA